MEQIDWSNKKQVLEIISQLKKGEEPEDDWVKKYNIRYCSDLYQRIDPILWEDKDVVKAIVRVDAFPLLPDKR